MAGKIFFNFIAVLCVSVLCVSVLIPSCGTCEEPEFYDEIGQEIVVVGKIIPIKMTALPDDNWTETAVRTSDGEEYILIGAKVSEINGLKEFGDLIIKGTLAPKMQARGKWLKVVEVSDCETAKDKKLPIDGKDRSS